MRVFEIYLNNIVNLYKKKSRNTFQKKKKTLSSINITIVLHQILIRKWLILNFVTTKQSFIWEKILL